MSERERAVCRYCGHDILMVGVGWEAIGIPFGGNGHGVSPYMCHDDIGVWHQHYPSE